MAKKKTNQQSPGSEMIFYGTPERAVKVEVLFEDETFWLSQKKMAELFGVDVRTANKHLKKNFQR